MSLSVGQEYEYLSSVNIDVTFRPFTIKMEKLSFKVVYK